MNEQRSAECADQSAAFPCSRSQLKKMEAVGAPLPILILWSKSQAELRAAWDLCSTFSSLVRVVADLRSTFGSLLKLVVEAVPLRVLLLLVLPPDHLDGSRSWDLSVAGPEGMLSPSYSFREEDACLFLGGGSL